MPPPILFSGHFMSYLAASFARMRLTLGFAALLSLPMQAQTRPTPSVSPLSRHYLAAQAAMAKGDKETAADEWRMFLTDALGEIAVTEAHAGQYQKAASAFEQALTFAPHSSDLQLQYADAALRDGDLDTAHSLAARLTREAPQNANGHMLLGQVLLKQEKNAEARTEFEEATRRDPTFAAGYNLAVSCLNLGDEKCAASTFAEMRASFGDTAIFDLHEGQAYLNSDFQNHAVDAFKAAIARDPRLPGAHYSLAAAYLATSAGVDEAEKELREEIALVPKEAVAYAALGHLQEGQQHFAEAETSLKRAIAFAPDDPDAYLYLGQLYAEQKRVAEAEAALRRCIELTTDVSRNNHQVQRAHYLLGRLLLQSGDTAAGQQEMAISQSLMQRTLSKARDRLADYYQQPSEAAGAEAAPQSAATADVNPKAVRTAAELEKQLSPPISDSYDNLGAVAGSAGHYNEALADFRRAVEWNPQTPGLDENMGRAAYAAGQFAEAVGPLNRYIAANPTDDTLRSALGISLSMTGDNTAAVKTLEPLVSQEKASLQVAFVYAQALLATGHAQQAINQLNALTAKLPQSAQIHRELGRAFAAANQPEKALDELGAATRLDPKDARAWLALGRIELKEGKSTDAVASLESALQLEPSDADAHRVLAAAYRAAGRADDAAREIERSQELTQSASH